jgi:predicted Rossmann fold nucleotide-binding protein DprA/Smf involved in DNA uptake
MEPLSPNTQATLLLVGRFTQATADRPLSTSEYQRLAKALHARNLRPSDLMRAVPDDLGIKPERLTGLLGRGTALALAVERWSQLGIRVLGRSDLAYPARLRARLKGAAAPIIFVAGATDLLDEEGVCIVGSREATEAGLAFAERLGARCAVEALTVVSGDARGIDRAAMDGALAQNGRVIGVLADSLGKAVLAKRHREAILSGRLALLSPFMPEAPFSVAYAMDRNKYLYALAIAAVVVDSDVKGGTWTGAVENAKHGWVPVLVRDGPDVPAGNRALVTKGLTPIREIPDTTPGALRELLATSPARIADHLTLTDPPSAQHSNCRDEAPFDLFLRQLCAWLRAGPQTEDVIAARFDLEPGQTRRWLDRGRDSASIARIDAQNWGLAPRRVSEAQPTLPL